MKTAEEWFGEQYFSHRSKEELCEIISAIQKDAMASCLNQSKSTPLEWQPIETAPRDGTRIIISDGCHVGEGHWFRTEGRWAYDGLHLGCRPEQPNEWMPLPAPTVTA